jgi:hypothetical protein|tara:strand:+ start:17095 stop:17298 length:204 start_codon:yes stop_codon:yes gene_type:complete
LTGIASFSPAPLGHARGHWPVAGKRAPNMATKKARTGLCEPLKNRHLVEPSGIEPLTSSLRTTRSPN